MTSGTSKQKKSAERVDRKLDEGLVETFPASDPPALTDPSCSIVAAPKRPKKRTKRQHRA